MLFLYFLLLLAQLE